MKRLRVFGLPWHTSHQAELAKLPFMGEYALQINPYRTWAETQRDMPANVHYVPYYEKGKYDFAILHIDQQSIYNPDQGDRISKGRLYQEINETIQDIPKVVINHMTPFHDKYENADVVKKIKEMIGDNIMVCNSNEARLQWGWGHTITHGLNPDEWWDLPKEPRCITSLSPAGMEKAYRRIFLNTTARILSEKKVPYYWIGVDVKFNSWDSYREFVGRSLVYFNPTWQSPMPRARTEAMFSGCCVVTTPYHDADTFIKNGVNGFLTSRERIIDPRIMDNAQYTADIIERLIVKEPKTALKVGQEGKKTAMDIFHQKKFHEQWIKFVTEVVGIKL